MSFSRTLGLAAMLGVLVGLGAFTFRYAEGLSYFSDDPRSCVNCHVMRGAFDGWIHASHTAAATCNDCHTPEGFPDKWLVKGLNGWNHSVAFTTGNFPDPLVIRKFNARVVQENCVKCHNAMVSQMHRGAGGQEVQCVFCHGNVGHGR